MVIVAILCTSVTLTRSAAAIRLFDSGVELCVVTLNMAVRAMEKKVLAR